MQRGAVFSPCGLFRYSLDRQWGPAVPYVLWVMLNPSTADAEQDDPTIRRCIRFTQDWGYGALKVCNLYALRATDPLVLIGARYPVGDSNDAYIRDCAGQAALIVCAWGTKAEPTRSARVKEIIRSTGARPACLSMTKSGEPGHPLYLRGDLRPVELT